MGKNLGGRGGEAVGEKEHKVCAWSCSRARQGLGARNQVVNYKHYFLFSPTDIITHPIQGIVKAS